MIKAEVGNVVQLQGDGWWAGCLMVVDEVRTWGVIGMVITHEGAAPLRVPTKEIAAVYRKVEESNGVV